MQVGVTYSCPHRYPLTPLYKLSSSSIRLNQLQGVVKLRKEDLRANLVSRSQLERLGGPPQPPPSELTDPGGGNNGDDGGDHSSHEQQTSKPPPSDHTAGFEDVLVLDISGMHCGSCASRVKRILENHPRVSQANVNLTTEVALVRVRLPDSSRGKSEDKDLQVIAAQLLQVLIDNGFTAKIRDKRKTNAAAAAIVRARREERSRRMKEAGWKVGFAWILASGCVIGHLPHWWRGAPQFLQKLASPHLHATLSIVAILGPGREIIQRGWQAMRQQRPDMNSLVGLGACASFAVSMFAAARPSLGWPTFFEEPAMLLGCVLLGRALEERAKLMATSDLSALQGLVPEKARLEIGRAGAFTEVTTEALTTGDILILLPGEKFPVDGIVVSGTSSCNEAALTGEPMPTSKAPGSEVTAGTVNMDGKLRIRVCKTGAATTMSDILRLVENAQGRAAPVQRVADTVAGKFAVAVMGASFATLAFWGLAGPTLFPKALARYCSTMGTGKKGALLLSFQLACNVLTVACPCALGLAAPTAVLVATSAAARRGLLIRGGDVLEEASHIETVVFDKTGTLTQGRPKIHRIIPSSAGLASDRLLALAAALERESSHPLATAVLRAARESGCQELVIDEGSCKQKPGCGVSGQIQGQPVSIGSQEYVREQLHPGEHSAADRFLEASTSATSGNMQMCISVGGKLAGIFTLTDQLRSNAADTVEYLRQRGYNVHMLSGDVEPTAQRIARAVGIPSHNVHASMKPGGKAALIKRLQTQGHRVAMVGDGINDAGALAAANVGLAMGGGIDAASEVANIVLLGDRLPQVAEALQISKCTFAKIKQNLCWAFGYNLVGIPIAAGALLPIWGLALTPSVSGALMGVSSLAVMANSLTLQYQQAIDFSKSNSMPSHILQAEQMRERSTDLQMSSSKHAQRSLL